MSRLSRAVHRATNSARSIASDVRSNDLYDYTKNVAGSKLNLLTFGGYDTASSLAAGNGFAYDPALLGKDYLNSGNVPSMSGDAARVGVSQPTGLETGMKATTPVTPGATYARQRLFIDPKRDAEAQAAKDSADAEAAAAAAIAGLPKDPNVADIAAQRKQRDGRRGTILTTPGQSLGSIGGASASGKSLLGL